MPYANAEDKLEWRRRYDARRREQCRLWHAQWRRNNSDKVRAMKARQAEVRKIKRKSNPIHPHRAWCLRREKWKKWEAKWKKANPKKYSEIKRFLHKKRVDIDPIKYWLNRHRARLKQYGITELDFDILFYIQDGRCPICGEAFEGKRDMRVDHCHAIKGVRGILCNKCNLGIGQMRDSIILIHKAIAYLEINNRKDSQCI